MESMAPWIAASARLLRDALTPRNRTQLAVVVSDDGLVNDTPAVTVSFGGAARRATWLLPNAIVVGKSVFVERLDPRLDASLAVVAPGYQIPWS